LLGSYEKIEAIRRTIEQRSPVREKVSTSVDLPLSHESKRVLAYGAEESERMNHKEIGTVHLLAGLLREEKCFGAELLREQGLTLESVREKAGVREPPAAQGGSIGGLYGWIAELEARKDIWIADRANIGRSTADFAIYAGDPPKESELEERRLQVPFLCIDVIRGHFFSEVRRRSEDYIAEGVAEVWLLDPGFRRAYTVTKTEGLRVFKDQVLRIADPPLEMDLRKIFG
jgi:hypothetical protein